MPPALAPLLCFDSHNQQQRAPEKSDPKSKMSRIEIECPRSRVHLNFAAGCSIFESPSTLLRFKLSRGYCPGLLRILPNALSSGSISIIPGLFAPGAAGAGSAFRSAGFDILAGAATSAGGNVDELSSSCGSVSGGSGF